MIRSIILEIEIVIQFKMIIDLCTRAVGLKAKALVLNWPYRRLADLSVPFPHSLSLSMLLLLMLPYDAKTIKINKFFIIMLHWLSKEKEKKKKKKIR